MGISGAVDWWEEWQLRILVLGSVLVQWLLFLSAPHRKRAIPSWFRSLIWLAYLGSDALAIYALANLFSRQRRQDCSSGQGNSILEVVWAPVLLMHLGGQDCITAYNIEDNELWTRHVLTAVSQITVAVYVFCKSWPGGDKKLLQASILFFVPGILKCIEKPWALKNASFNSLVSLSDPYIRPKMMRSRASLSMELAAPHQRMAHLAGPVPGTVRRAASISAHRLGMELWNDQLFPRAASEAARPSRMVRIRRAISIEDYVQKARDIVLASSHPQTRGEIDAIHPWWQRLIPTFMHSQHQSDVLKKWRMERLNLEPLEKFVDLESCKLFLDMASSYPDRLIILEIFLVHGVTEKAYASLQKGLFRKFDLLYTKAKIVPMSTDADDFAVMGGFSGLTSAFSSLLRAASMYLPFAAIGLFHKSQRGAYNVNDVMVTYILFCCTAVLEVFWLMTMRSMSLLNSPVLVTQYSLVGFFARNKRHSMKMCILSSLNCKDFLDQRWCMKSCSSSLRITELVLGYVKCCWEKHIVDAASYRRFSDQRGQWTIQHKGCDQDQEWGLNRSFDESVLLWHIATDLCFYQKGDTSASHANAAGCREISNYMTYLLFIHPEMLLPGTRRNLFKIANAELEKIFKDEKPLLKAILKGDKPSPEEIERRLVDRIIAKVQLEYSEQVVEHTDSPPDADEYPAPEERFIRDAWKISELLLSLGDEKTWEVIEGVWVEMLCFSASRCRGFLHAKSLGTGGELLTYIWLLLSHMGMETLPERAQRTKLSSGGGIKLC